MLSIICFLLLIRQGGTESVYREGLGNLSAVDSCGLWTTVENFNGSTRCICGSGLGGVVHCNNITLQVQLLPCYCMTPYAKDPSIAVVGACLYKCVHGGASFYSPVSNVTVGALTYYMCNTIVIEEIEWRNREGQLCGKCKEDFAPPVYSYDLSCVKCSQNEPFISNLVKYCVIAFLPLTFFFIALVTLRISATSPLLNAFVLVCQVLTSPLQVILIYFTISKLQKSFVILLALIISFGGIWNLDFFRTLYPQFCLHPNMNILQVLALDYIIAAYPLLLIVITYFLVELHDHNCRIVVLLWKPFRRCFAHFHRQWDIRTSLIEAFASFLLLSYVKFLSVSLNFLLPVYLYNVHGELMEPYLYYDGTVEYFGKQHLPYAILAIAVLIMFIILPLLLLCLYPCQCFQKILNFYGLRCQVLHTFMDAFQGCYKNGTDGTRDCRYLSAVYLFIRIVFFVITAVSLSFSVDLIYFLTGILFSLLTILIAVLQPYKFPIYNIIDIMLNLVASLFFFSIMTHRLAHSKYEVLHSVTNIMQYILVLILFVFIIVVGLKKLLNQPFCMRLMGQNISNTEEPLLDCPEQRAALLHEPVSDDQDPDDVPE